MIRKIFALGFLAMALTLTSCLSTQDLAYLQDADADEFLKHAKAHSPLIKPNDLLSIAVSSSKPELAAPYNLLSLYNDIRTTGPQSNAGTYYRQTVESYLVDSDGTIDFPVLGKMKVGGMTREQLSADLKAKLEGAMPDPVVTINFLNFKVTVLGEVFRPGTFTVQGDRITVFDAIGLAGDLTPFGVRDNVFLIREYDGQSKVVRLSLKSKTLIESPYYYLEQNDVLYVHANKAKANSASTFRNDFPLYISAGSLLVSIATLISVLATK